MNFSIFQIAIIAVVIIVTFFALRGLLRSIRRRQ